jgi:hypothetical protein
VNGAELVPAAMLNPLTGELVPTGDMKAVADTLVQLREHQNKVRDAITAFSEAAIAESVRVGSRTLNASGGIRIEVTAATEVEWDIPHLSKLRDHGLPEERLNELVKTNITFKVDGAVARQLAGSNPNYARVIEEAKVHIPKRQYAYVKW